MGILITGGNGFIASHLVNNLTDYKVFLHTRSPRETSALHNHRENYYLVGPLTLDFLNKNKIDGCDCIIHLAGSFSANTFEELIFNNLITTQNILDFMKIKRIPKIIFISSAAVWGKNLEGIASEDIPAKPETDYAHTKFAAECLIKNAYLKGDIDTAFILRPNTIYGHGSSSGVINSLVNQASKGLKLQIHGDGLQRRQPLNIEDLIDAITKCLISNLHGLNTYGIAGPESYTVLDIAQKVSSILGLKFECEFYSAQTNRPQTILINQSKINQELLWRPRITLDHGLKSIFDLNTFNN